MESHYTADSCAEYLSKFYILPHTYKQSIVMGLLVPLLASVATTVAITLAVLLYLLEHKHHPNLDEHVGLGIGALYAIDFFFCFFMLSFMWRKMVITHRAIDISLSISKTHIPANYVLGYALDSIQRSKGPPAMRLSIVHGAPGKPQEKTRVTCNPDDLNDPKLRGLFLSMSNYGDVPLSELLDDAGNDKYPRLEKIVLLGVFLLTSVILWTCLPLIHSAIEQLRTIPGPTG